MMNLTCCVSCGVGSSKSEKDVPPQVEKFNEYICVSCEKQLNAIIETDDQVFINKGYGLPCEALITRDTVYYFDGPIIADPEKSFLGFGGRWFIVVIKKKMQYGFEQEILVTNNLWHSRSIPNGFQKKLEESNVINADVIPVNKSSIEDLLKRLNETPYLKVGDTNER